MTARSDALLAWYERERRPLPWRATRDPYALLVSEVMLQQTQAARVVPFYEAFLDRFPDAGALAAAPARDVLAAWSGLGYNRRALALQAAARVVAERGWPADLTELPGVGPYTAAAVAAFAWDAQTGRGRRQRAARDRALGRLPAAAAATGAARRRAAPARSRRGVEPGDDGAGRDGLHRPRPALRGVPGRGVVRRRGRARAARRRARRGSASRTPTATRAGGSSRRCSAVRSCRRSRQSGSSARWPASLATG